MEFEFIGVHLPVVHKDGGSHIVTFLGRFFGNDEEDVKKMRYSNSQYWYGDNFLVYGTQVVKNSKTGERRKVFAITKYTIK